MRRFYSFMLMAAMLFISASVKAETATELQTAINNAANGDVITLTGNVEMGENDVIWLGTAGIDGAFKTVTLDLNGKKIKRTGAGATYHFFVLTHGKLIVKNTGAASAYIGFESGKSSATSTIFSVYGSHTPCENFSHLVIEDGVNLQMPEGCLGTAIAIDVVSLTRNSKENGVASWASGNTLNYTTAVLAGGYGYAFGVKVEVKGDISSIGADHSDYKALGASNNKKSYGIKTNGLLETPKSTRGLVAQSFLSPFGMNVNDFSGRNSWSDDNVPFVHVYSTSEIETANYSTRSAAIYASGYAHWLIEGDCSGNIGVAISSGEVDINNAIIASTSELDHTSPSAVGGVSGSGSAIVVNSRDGYTGFADITITGSNTQIVGKEGYALEEVVNTTGTAGTKVEAIDIQGGTFSSDPEAQNPAGSISISETTTQAAVAPGDQTTITITEAKIDGTVTFGTSTTIDPQTQQEVPAHSLEDFTNASAVIPGTTSQEKIVVPLTIRPNEDHYASYAAPIDLLLPSDLKAYAGQVNGDVLELKEVNYIQANQGVILYGVGSNYQLIQPNNTNTISAVHTLDDDLYYGKNDLKPGSAFASLGADEKDRIYCLRRMDNATLFCKYVGATMPEYKAYLDLNDLQSVVSGSAPARIRMVIAETQDVENVEKEAVKAVKFVKDGQIVIRRGDKVFNMQGQIVK